MPFTVLIPARLASTRLPDKPLADIGGVPMVVRVAWQAARSQAAQVVVAADSARIVAACRDHGVQALLTAVEHPSGSDRLAEACAVLGLPEDGIVVNVQGDEPLLPPEMINEVAMLLERKPVASMSTAAHPIHEATEFSNPNVVKVVLDADAMAMYFSRAPIPWKRDAYATGVQSLAPPLPLRHIGIYGYRVGFLRQYPKLPAAPAEMMEALEQLRALWHGYRIAVHISDTMPGPGVDTPEDLARVRRIFASAS